MQVPTLHDGRPLAWIVEADMFANQSGTSFMEGHVVGVLDTGTSLLLVPENTFYIFQVDLIPNVLGNCLGFYENRLVSYCNAAPVDVNFTFRDVAGKSITIRLNSKNLRWTKVGEARFLLWRFPICALLGIGQSPLNLWIFGDTFLRQTRVAFDYMNKTIILGAAKAPKVVSQMEAAARLDVSKVSIAAAVGRFLYRYRQFGPGDKLAMNTGS
eukprot:TRINITY_DN14120_c0_g1_i4.p1 TRINITY_DN14120_c0_g1~~TRINITY_DN14120_c0_g1_i4.p1  ORF type:complete len:213 (-),score=25.88 TRINITY_DN14120_c0_g1_i4:52-690(-)